MILVACFANTSFSRYERGFSVEWTIFGFYSMHVLALFGSSPKAAI